MYKLKPNLSLMISVGTANWTPKCPVTIGQLRKTHCLLRESNYSTSCMDRNDLSLLKIIYYLYVECLAVASLSLAY